MKAVRFGVLLALLAFLVLPVAVVLLCSFNPGYALTFPPHAFTLAGYRSFFGNPTWRQALAASAAQGGGAAILSVLLGSTIAAAIGLVRRAPLRRLLLAVAMSPMIVPVIVFATADSDLVSKLRFEGALAVIAAQAVLGTPYVLLMVLAASQRFDPTLVDAGRVHGDSGLGVHWRIRWPLILPYLGVGGLLSMAVAVTDPLMPLFVGAPDGETLARKTAEDLQNGISSTDVVASLMMIGLLVLLAGAAAAGTVGWRRMGSRRLAREVRAALAPTADRAVAGDLTEAADGSRTM
jgi:mannopine transport system permease protein